MTKRSGYLLHGREESILYSLPYFSDREKKNVYMNMRKSVLLPETVATGKMSFASYSLFRITRLRKTERKLNRKG